MKARLSLATVASVLVVVSALVPALAGSFALVASGGHINFLVVSLWVCVVGLWWAILWIVLRTLEKSVWGASPYAWRAAAGAIGGFIVGFLARDALFVTGCPDSDYPAPAYALLYAITLLGAVVTTVLPSRNDTGESAQAA